MTKYRFEQKPEDNLLEFKRKRLGQESCISLSCQEEENRKTSWQVGNEVSQHMAAGSRYLIIVKMYVLLSFCAFDIIALNQI